ncbi:SpoIIE family protein phosphatase [Stakelama sp. CBK3Z-3]|uniref:SpoIIE family protein phosphatase n=1 Tax=Stakelama flava TaxID=2860338 RepID=A0ABS6XIW4_9SPHN|nr:SpoIIE family protein phosphatase [Stakelama flava]MBW4330117.1 SpoIIE family protein phosphatase [Stakelama flava]
MIGWLKIGDPSAVAEARRRARRTASLLGFDPYRLENIAIVATEIAQNILRHGGGGKMLVQLFGPPGDEKLYLIGIDEGPGIRRVDRMLEDGVSTGGSAGTGLGAIRRLSDRMDIDTAPGAGTVVTAEFTSDSADPAWDHTGLRIPYPGEQKCGDAVAARVAGAKAWYLVCDGLGHGVKAASAASAAKARFLETPADDPVAILDTMNEALEGTRGAVAAVVRIDRASARLDYAAIGNITTMIVQDRVSRRLAVRDGLLGGRRTSPHEESAEIGADAMVLMHSDGLATLRRVSERPTLMQRSSTVVAARLLAEATRGRDDSSILVTRMRAARAL